MADNIIKAGVQITAGVDGLENISRLGQEIEAAGSDAAHLQDKYTKLNREFERIGKQQALIDGFRRLKMESQDVAAQLEAARKETAELAKAVKANPTDKLVKDFEQAKNQAAALKIRQAELNRELHQSRQRMNDAGISVRQLANVQNQLAQRSQAAQQKLGDLTREAAELKKLASARHTLGLDVKSNAEAEIAKIRQALAELKNAAGISRAELKRATAAADEQIRTLRQNTEALPKTKMTPLAASIGGIGAAAAGAAAGVAALGVGIHQILDKTQEFAAIATRLNYAFEGAEAGAAQLAFVREEANRLGLEVLSAANGYAQFASAAKDLNITQEQTQQVFKGVASAAAAMGLNAEEANGVFLALSQIAGKGKVSMEELRGQLGERLTPAMAIAAKSMGVTSAELEKMVENGLAAEVFLPKFGAALEQAFGAEAAKNAESLGGQINLLKNNFNELLNYLGESGVADAAVAVMKDIGEAVDWIEQQLKNLDNSAVGSGLREALSGAYELLKDIGGTLGEVLTTAFDNINDLGSAIGGILSDGKGEFDAIRFAVDGVNLAIGLLRDGVAGIGVAFNLFSGAVKETLAYAAEGLEKLSWGDWSRELTEFAQTMHTEAGKSFEKAEQAALSFESKASAAWEKMGDTAAERSKRMVQDTQQSYTELAAAAEEAAKKAEEAQIRATAAIGTAAEESTKKQAAELAKAAAAAQAAADKAAAAWHKQMGIEMPKAVEPLTEAVGATEKALADAKAAATGLGLDLRAAMNETTPAMNEVLENIGKLRSGFDGLKADGVNAVQLLDGALQKALKTAANQADLEAVKTQYKELGETGRLSAQEVERGLLAVEQRLHELKGSTDPVEAAFKKLGLESKNALKLAAEEARQAFETVKKSGQASEESLKQAFANAAEAMLKSGDDAQRSWVSNQAAVYGYKLAVDETGKAALQAAAETKQATDQQTQAHQKAATAAEKQAQAAAQAADASSKSAKANKDGTKAAEDNEKAVKSQTRAVSEYEKAINEMLIKTKAWAHLGKASWSMVGEHIRGTYFKAQDAIKGLNSATESGINLADRLARAEAVAIAEADKLDKASLDNLHTAIDKARQKMQALADDAKQTREDLQASLDELNGDSDASARLAQQRKIAELRKKQQQAERTGNRDAAADYAQSVEIQQQIWQRQQAKKAEEAARQQREAEARAEQERQREAERQRQEAERKRQEARQEIRLPERTQVAVNIDNDRLLQALAARDGKVAGMAVEQVLTLLEQAQKRSQ